MCVCVYVYVNVCIYVMWVYSLPYEKIYYQVHPFSHTHTHTHTELSSPAVGLRPTMTSYAQVVRAACVCGDTHTAIQWLHLMKQRRLQPDVRVYNHVIYACLARAEAHTHTQTHTELQEVLMMMEREGVKPNQITHRAKEQILRVLASRMRTVSDSFVGKLKLVALSKGEKKGGE